MVFFGDSHTHAVIRALRDAAGAAVRFEVHQMKRLKNDRDIGDVTVEEAHALVRELEPDDVVISLMGGNQHQILGLVQHQVPFDLFVDAADARPPAGIECIPRQALRDIFGMALRGKDWTRLSRIKEGARCPVFHMVPPPPKEDAAHIGRRHETAFVAGILDRGISPAPLRLKLWQLQGDVLRELGAETGIGILPPPEGSQTAAGFLKPEYYADDATHGNAAYGALVLEVAARLALGRPRVSEAG